jgi:hypothetical protein
VNGSTALAPASRRHRFRGTIAGLGSTSGVRVVVGWWRESPYGAFADVMLAQADGTRRLLAPTDEIADFVAGTYLFDVVEVVPVTVARSGPEVSVRAGELDVSYDVGRRTALGHALRLVPARLATSPSWCRVTDPVARVALRGVRTRGSAGADRLETYGATDHHTIEAVRGSWRGRALGGLAKVLPEPGFGFGSTPPAPSVTTLVTTVLDARPVSA